MRALLSVAAVLFVSSLGLAAPAPWKLDAGHSRVGFKVSHLVVSEVTGQFREFGKTEIQLDEQDLTKSSAHIEIKAGSIDTGDGKRDEHLRGADFFDAAKYPLVSFASRSITRGTDGGYRVAGDLSIRDVKKPVTLDAKVSEAVKGPRGSTVRAGINLDLLPDRRFRVNNGTPRPITAHESLLENHFDLAVRFLDQTLRAADWARDNIDGVRQILESETRGGPEGVITAYGENFHRSLHPDLSTERLELFRQQKNFLLVHGILDRDFDYDAWVDPRPLEAAKKLQAARANAKPRAEQAASAAAV